MTAMAEWMLKEVFPILVSADWEIFLNPSGTVLALSLDVLLSVLLRKVIACRVTLLFPLRRRSSAVTRKSKYHASSFALPAMALAANLGQIPRHAQIAAAPGKLEEFSKAFLGDIPVRPAVLAAEAEAL